MYKIGDIVKTISREKYDKLPEIIYINGKPYKKYFGISNLLNDDDFFNYSFKIEKYRSFLGVEGPVDPKLNAVWPFWLLKNFEKQLEFNFE